MPASTRDSEATRRLLARVIDALADGGIGDRSLRQIATVAGTSHRMLLYHFGSRAGLLVAVARDLERRQRALLTELLAELRETAATADDRRRAALAMWRRISDPELAAYERLFFELYGAALAGDAAARSLLDEAVESWLEPLGELLEPGRPPEDAVRRSRARLALDVTRGALLDLLATGDRGAVDQAMEEFATMLFPPRG